jgi:predicted Mrr-cat superfamily restriction endonuclease
MSSALAMEVYPQEASNNSDGRNRILVSEQRVDFHHDRLLLFVGFTRNTMEKQTI